MSFYHNLNMQQQYTFCKLFFQYFFSQTLTYHQKTTFSVLEQEGPCLLRKNASRKAWNKNWRNDFPSLGKKFKKINKKWWYSNKQRKIYLFFPIFEGILIGLYMDVSELLHRHVPIFFTLCALKKFLETLDDLLRRGDASFSVFSYLTEHNIDFSFLVPA